MQLPKVINNITERVIDDLKQRPPKGLVVSLPLNLQEISNYLNQGTRNRIVFCRDSVIGIEFIDVGKEVAMLLNNMPTDSSSFETICKQVVGTPRNNDLIGKYLAIENIGILFEPELKLDVRSMLDCYSRNQCLIIKSDAIITNDILYFLSTSDNTRVSLQGLSYKQI